MNELSLAIPFEMRGPHDVPDVDEVTAMYRGDSMILKFHVSPGAS